MLRPVGSPPGPAGPDAGRPVLLTARWRQAGLWSRAAPLVAVAAVAVPATFLRLWNLNALGFNSDEAVYAGQAASIAGDPQLSKLFPVFRAHPLLFQMVASLAYRFQVGDLAPRLLAVAFGLATVVAGYAAGRRIYGHRAGLIAALLLAAMPYLVVVNRQALLDGPMAFFTVVALWLLAKLAAEGRPGALYGAGAALGLAFISKETSVVLIPAAYAFLALTPSVRVRLRDLWIFFGCIAAVALPYPVSLLVAGGSRSGQHFLTWQLFRPPNHAWTFYASVVPAAIGIPVLLCGAGTLAVAAAGHSWTWRESLLVCWIAVPLFFFQLWPVKGFQYLLPIAAPCAVLAAGLLASPQLGRWLSRWPGRWPGNWLSRWPGSWLSRWPGSWLSRWPGSWLSRGSGRAGQVLSLAVTVFVAGWLAVTCWLSIDTANSTTFLAGTGGVPGGRQAGRWIMSHTPGNAAMLAIGPSMANILEFYGDRRVLGLAVSANPLHRNPVYTPVRNPDLLLRTGQVQYLVWDAYSAGRSTFFSQRLMAYARRYHGHIVHAESVMASTPDGTVRRPVIVIYQVRP